MLVQLRTVHDIAACRFQIVTPFELVVWRHGLGNSLLNHPHARHMHSMLPDSHAARRIKRHFSTPYDAASKCHANRLKRALALSHFSLTALPSSCSTPVAISCTDPLKPHHSVTVVDFNSTRNRRLQTVTMVNDSHHGHQLPNTKFHRYSRASPVPHHRHQKTPSSAPSGAATTTATTHSACRKRARPSRSCRARR